MTTVEIQKISPWYTTEEIAHYFKMASRTLNRHMNNLKYGHHYFRKNVRNPRSPILCTLIVWKIIFLNLALLEIEDKKNYVET